MGARLSNGVLYKGRKHNHFFFQTAKFTCSDTPFKAPYRLFNM